MVRLFSRWRRRRDPTPDPDEYSASDELSDDEDSSDSGISTTAATTDTNSSYTSSDSEGELESDVDETDYKNETTASTHGSRSRLSATSAISVTRSRKTRRSLSPTALNRSRDSSGYSVSISKSRYRNRSRSLSLHYRRCQSADSALLKRSVSRGRPRNKQILSNAPNEPVRTTVIPIRSTAALKEQGEKLQQMKNDPKMQSEWNKQFPTGAVVAYTDGSCFNNSSSGFGVFFGPGHVLNRAERVDGPMHNSCLTEIIAAQRALTMLKQWAHYKNEAVIVRTDFLPLVQSMSKGVNRKATFAHYYLQLHSLAKSMPNGVQFQHVYGHGDDPGNQAADELARQAALSTSSRSRSRSVSCVRVKVNRTRGRSASRSNNRQHIRSHSAFVRGRA